MCLRLCCCVGRFTRPVQVQAPRTGDTELTRDVRHPVPLSLLFLRQYYNACWEYRPLVLVTQKCKNDL
jgi:hypothetical protein